MRIRGLAAALAAATLVAVLVTPASGAQRSNGGGLLTVEGTVVILADAPGTSAAIVTEDDVAVPIEGPRADGLETGDLVEATVVTPDDVTDIEELVELDEPLELASLTVVESAPTIAAGVSAGKTRYVDIAVNTNGNVTQPSNAEIQTLLAQVYEYWRANTYDEFGPLSFTIKRYSSSLTCNVNDAYTWAADAARQFGRSSSSYIATSANPRHLVLFGECNPNDGVLGVATVGNSIDYGGWTLLRQWLYQNATSKGYALSTLSHELGHNLGLEHAGAIKPADCDYDDVPAYTELEWCVAEEYLDQATVMGYATSGAYAPGLLDVARRDQLKVLPSGALANIYNGQTQTYTLNTVGAASGTRGIRIETPGKARTYYVEYRTAAAEPNSYASTHGESRAVRVLEVVGAETILKPARNNLLPENDVNITLNSGDRWHSDAGDVFIEVTAASDASAQVTVKVGPMPSATVAAPTLPARPAVGQAITAAVASPDPADANLTYQWFQGQAPAASATGLTFTPTSAATGKSVRLLVTATAAGRAPTQAVSNEAAGWVPGTSTVIVGKVKMGRTLTVMPGTQVPGGATLTYQWLRGGSAISGATQPTYVVKGADIGKRLRARVTATVAGVATHYLSPESIVVKQERFLANALPALQGGNRPGQTLSVKTATWNPAPSSVKYRWYREDKLISGATSPTYTIVPRDYGAIIWAEVQPVKDGYQNEWWSVAAWVEIVGGTLNLTPPALTGKAKVGAKVTPTGNSWVYNAKVSYQWLRDGKAIKGATKSTYTPTAADRGKKLSLRVKGSHTYIPDTATKTTKALTVGYGTLKKGAVKVSGTAKVGKKLTAKTGTWTSGTKFTYKWYANGKVIKGATKKTFTPKRAHAGKTITVKVTGKKTAYTTASKTSAKTAKVKQ